MEVIDFETHDIVRMARVAGTRRRTGLATHEQPVVPVKRTTALLDKEGGVKANVRLRETEASALERVIRLPHSQLVRFHEADMRRVLFLERVAMQPQHFEAQRDRPARGLAGLAKLRWIAKRAGMTVEHVRLALEIGTQVAFGRAVAA